MPDYVTADYLVRLESGNMRNQLSKAPRVAGDVISCKIRPHKGWGAGEQFPTYGIITVPDILESDARARCGREQISEVDREAGQVARRTHFFGEGVVDATKQNNGRLQMSKDNLFRDCNRRANDA